LSLNIHIHCLVLDRVYRRSAVGEPQFVQVTAPNNETVQAVFHQIIKRMMKLLTRQGVLVEEQGETYLAGNDSDSHEAGTLGRLQAAPVRTGQVRKHGLKSLSSRTESGSRAADWSHRPLDRSQVRTGGSCPGTADASVHR
jgi:Putative transposase